MPATKRYVAFLRGVSPMNAKMAQLKHAFEQAGFKNVVTVLTSGNVVFDAPAASNATLERKAETAMARHLGRSFLTIVRPVAALHDLLERNPFQAFRVAAGAKRVVTFLREPPKKKQALPVTEDTATVHAVEGTEVFTSYVPSPAGPVFMTLIERTFGKDVTTRTWDTIRKCAKA